MLGVLVSSDWIGVLLWVLLVVFLVLRVRV